MTTKKQKKHATKSAHVGSPVYMVHNAQEVSGLFRTDTFEIENVKEVGYDVRLGNHVTFVTRGKEKKLQAGEKIAIMPGETILAVSEEILDLPNNVCATGSPCMRLLLDGLWSHGGKTDFGFDQNLRLGFANLGSTKIELQRGQPIFNIIFWRVDGKTAPRRSNSVPHRPSASPSPLDLPHWNTKKFRTSVLKRDGIQAYRLLTWINSQHKHLTRVVWLFGLILLAANAAAIAMRLWPPAEDAAFWGTIGGSVAAGAIAVVLSRLGRSGPTDEESVSELLEDSDEP